MFIPPGRKFVNDSSRKLNKASFSERPLSTWTRPGLKNSEWEIMCRSLVRKAGSPGAVVEAVELVAGPTVGIGPVAAEWELGIGRVAVIEPSGDM